MNCADFERLIALGAPEARGHLAQCAACRQLAEELRETQAVLRSLGEENVDETAYAAVRAHVLEHVGERRTWPWKLAIAAALFLVLALGALVRLRAPAPAPKVVAEAPKRVEIASEAVAPAPPPPPPVRKRPKPAAVKLAAPARAEPLMVKIFTEDPDVVIYWFIDSGKGDSL